MSGILLDFPVSDVTSQCTECYNVPYNNATTDAEILACEGPALFVGALKEKGASTFAVGAFDKASEVMKATVKNQPHLSNGVYWYRTLALSFGFLPESWLSQWTCDNSNADPQYRLCWHTVILYEYLQQLLLLNLLISQ